MHFYHEEDNINYVPKLKNENLLDHLSYLSLVNYPEIVEHVPFIENLYDLNPYVILNYAILDEDTNCWIWAGYTSPSGYGFISINGRNIRAHRYSYKCFNGYLPDDMVVRHLCHNPSCVNPDHLAGGNHHDNYLDSYELHSKRLKENTAFQSRIGVMGEKFANYNPSHGEVIINGVTYNSINHARKCTGIHDVAISRNLDPVTRVFDVERYRNNCIFQNRIPRV